jgi:hypothetical protein
MKLIILPITILETRNERPTILTPMSLLLIHLIRTETIEHIIVKQISHAVNQFGLTEKYDVFEMCSITHKVQKGKKWVTDVRALRDAIAHGHFHVKTGEKDWSITLRIRNAVITSRKHLARTNLSVFLMGIHCFTVFKFTF